MQYQGATLQAARLLFLAGMSCRGVALTSLASLCVASNSSFVIAPAGKMLLYGVLFSCLDPVLTVACCMAYRCARFVQPAGMHGTALHSRHHGGVVFMLCQCCACQPASWCTELCASLATPLRQGPLGAARRHRRTPPGRTHPRPPRQVRALAAFVAAGPSCSS